MPLQVPISTAAQPEFLRKGKLPCVAEAAAMFTEAAGHAGSTGATTSYLHVVAESLKLLTEGQSEQGECGGLLMRGSPGAKAAMQDAVTNATEACARLQMLCGPFVNVNLVVTDARPEQAGLKEFVSSSGAHFQTLLPFNERPVVLFSPCLSPLDIILRAASANPQSTTVAPSEGRESRVAEEEASPRLTKESTQVGSLECVRLASTGSNFMTEESARVLAWHSSRALSGLQAALSAAVAIGRLGGNSTLFAAKAAVQMLRLPTKTFPQPIQEAGDVVAKRSNTHRQSSCRATNLHGPGAKLPAGHVPSWYTGRPLTTNSSLRMDDAVTITLVPEVEKLSQSELRKVYPMIFLLVHGAGAEQRERDGVQKGNMSYKTFTAPFLPSLFRVSVGEGKSIVCYLDGSRFEKTSESRRSVFVPSPSSLFPRAHGAPLARAILSSLAANEACFRDALSLCVCESGGSRSRKKQRTENPGVDEPTGILPVGSASASTMPVASATEAQTSLLQGLWTRGIPPRAEVAANTARKENLRNEMQPAVEPEVQPEPAPEDQTARAEPVQLEGKDCGSGDSCGEDDLEKLCAYSGVRRPASKVSARGEFYCRPPSAPDSSSEVGPSLVLTKCALHECIRVTHHMCNIDFRDDNIAGGIIRDEDWEEGKKFCSLDCASKFKTLS